jgi:hypothetical protein
MKNIKNSKENIDNRLFLSICKDFKELHILFYYKKRELDSKDFIFR